jgi:hypothetical protein
MTKLITLDTLIDVARFQPQKLSYPNAWIGHIPFATWLIKTLNPETFVELGTHTGNSFLAFCQSVKEHGLSTRCFAVDTWKGDEHAGYYGEQVFQTLNSYQKEHYAAFSRLLRMTFDEASCYFSNGTIDLLHIDGLHTYDAVKHDFETWLPKLSSSAVVLFHDINVRENEFGVWKLWEEIKQQYPLNFEFLHSNGLGVLQISDSESSHILGFLEQDHKNRLLIRDFFSSLGEKYVQLYHLKEIEKLAAEQKKLLVERDAQLAERDAQLAEQDAQLAERDAQLAERDAQLAERDAHLNSLYTSIYWKITAPLRLMANAFQKMSKPKIRKG